MAFFRHVLFISLCTFIIHLGVSEASRSLKQSRDTNPTEQLILLSFAESLNNFQAVAKEAHLAGWSAASSGPCVGGIQVQRPSARQCDRDNTQYISSATNPWTGVSCDSTGRVTCINLSGLGLQGTLVGLANLAGLSNLAYIDLQKNQLTGTLPLYLGKNLSQIVYLHLDQNAINDSLPESWSNQDQFQALEELYLQNNNLQGSLPSQWGQSQAFGSLEFLDVSSNNLSGPVPGEWSQSSGAFSALQTAVLEPGNHFCGVPPSEFSAVRLIQEYITGPVYTNISSFNITCTPASERPQVQPYNTDDLSSAALAGIITGEVVFGLVLLVVAGIFHRRYRWRQERSWVLFDWDVVQEPRPPSRSFNLGQRFAWMHRHNSSDRPSQDSDGQKRTGSGSLFGHFFAGETKVHTRGGSWTFGDPHNGRAEEVGSGRKLSLPMQAWRDIMFEAHEVQLQQNADGSLKSLGNGSFGKVYKGHLRHMHECAVKVFENYTGERERELLLSEISILRSCRNDNVVQFYGVVLQKNDIWMVMELMQGNLYRHLARGHHCTWYFRGRSIALDIAKGMHYLHSRQIIHMDLKSPNILIADSGAAKVADVGLARVMGSESFVSQVCAGTMHWMAPEVLVHGTCTEKADIFSFGVILWEICTGEAPSRGRMTSVSVPEECPQNVADLIEACMDESPDKRPSALDIIDNLQSIPITSKPVPDPPWYAR